MPIDVRTLESGDQAEFYVTAAPSPGRPPQEQARELYEALAGLLRETGGRVFQERVFASSEIIEIVVRERAAALGDLDDGLAPTLLAAPPGRQGAIAGAQIHAVRGTATPEILRTNRAACGRILKHKDRFWVALSGIEASESGAAPDQARAMFERTESALREAGIDMRSVARTWIWLHDILAWYDDFNFVRNKFYLAAGLLDGEIGQQHLPASTGIGVAPASGTHCALDLIAVAGPDTTVQYFDAAGAQDSPYEYGSAFSRAARAATPAGKAVYISGTASIDHTGKTQHDGDAASQIEMTIENVRAALRDMDCGEDDLVQTLAYCKTPDVESIFLDRWSDLSWPCLTMVGDICRPDLLFELEATACPGARPL
jgi:enamine deaminase RidA (YjgF/YER057c/UK114 family)